MFEVALLIVVVWLVFRVNSLKDHIEHLDDELEGLYEDMTGDEIVEGDLYVTGTIVAGGDTVSMVGDSAVRHRAQK